MTQYGYMKATEFTKKQINVIYAKAKKGELKVEKWLMTELYNLADYYGYDSNASVEFKERFVKSALKNVFDNNIEEAQNDINWLSDYIYKSFSQKYQKQIDRALFI